jgi:hypothetical protein
LGITVATLAVVVGYLGGSWGTASAQQGTAGTTGFSGDFGDAPDVSANPNDFPSLLASNGARHTNPTILKLGNTATVENDSIQAGDSGDDGIVSSTPLKVKVKRTSSFDQAFLNVLIDSNGDNDWNDAGERVANDVNVFPTGTALETDFPVTSGTTPVSTRPTAT